MNVLITGGAGFIGSGLTKQLIKKGHHVTLFDNLSEQVHGLNPEINKTKNDQVRFIKGDVRERQNLQDALKGQEAVIHLAAETGTGQSMYEVHKYSDVNIGGTACLLDILTNEKHTIRKVIVASSRAIYGEGKYHCDKHGDVYPDFRKETDMLNGIFEALCPMCSQPVVNLATDEESKWNPGSIYGITKQTQEQLVLTACRSIGIPAIAFRYQNVYGPGQSLSNPYTGILSIFSTRIKNGKRIDIFEDGKQGRDFVYISDVVDATIMGLESPDVGWEAFNVGSGQLTTVKTVAETLADTYQSRDTEIRITGSFRLGDIRDNYADLTKIKSMLGFEPQVSFDEGIREFTEWVNRQEIKEDKLDESLAEMKIRGLFK